MTRTIVDFPGAYTTGEVIDREEILNEIKTLIDDIGQSHIIYLTGKGGMGKTFLLREVLKRCRPNGEWYTPESRLIAATEVVDLYHAETHSIEGLTENIRLVLPSQPDMSEYDAELVKFKQTRFHLAGMLHEVSALRDKLAEIFIKTINTNSQKRRLVLVLDTAETLLYEPGNIQKLLNLKTEGVDVRPWLIENFLPNIQNAVILIGGRPEPEQLREDLQKHVPPLHSLDITGFDQEKYVSEYLEAVAKQFEDTEPVIAARIRGIPEDTRKVIFRYTSGRPIFLALLIDYLAVTAELVREVKVSVEEAEAKSEAEVEQIRNNLEAELMHRLLNKGTLADEIIRYLALARKGLDKSMLAQIAQRDETEISDAVETLKKLSFVKIRPNDEKLFLHDEMYDMFGRHIRLQPTQRRSIYQRILAYYERMILSTRQKLADLLEKSSTRFRESNVPASSEVGNAEEITQLQETLFILMVEEVYYRFRAEPEAGFRAYRTYHKEMYWANAEDAAMQLHMEVLAFLKELVEKGKINLGLVNHDEIELELAFSWIEHYIGQRKHTQALDVVNGLRKKQKHLLEAGGHFSEARLKALEGLSLAYLGNHLQQADDLLRESLSQLKAFTPKDQFEIWEQNQLLADTLNTSGYLYRVMGRYKLATNAYQEAQQYWDKVVETSTEQTVKRAMRAQKANTTNNLSLALAMLGRYQDAQRQCRDGYDMRLELGQQSPMAFSLNTWGMIYVRDDHPREAEELCQYALGIFSELEQTRGIGLASTAVAEALRRRSGAATVNEPVTERTNRLKKAQEHCARAIDIFNPEKTEGKERLQLLEALIEQGCIFRDWYDLQKKYQTDDKDHPDSEMLFQQAEMSLRQAIEVGTPEAELAYKVADARINLAWLYFSAGKYESAEHEIQRAKEQIPDEYINLDRTLPEKETPQTFFWVQLGKAHLLLGLLALKKFHPDERDFEPLSNVGRNFTLSLAYNERFAPDFRDMRRAKDKIYECVKGLRRLEEFPVILRAAQTAASDYKLDQPPALWKFLVDNFSPPTEGL